ncbi:pentapeptide repeat-containing protein [Paenibacillus tundrae]|uniref:pentapeptide repeat-containing protein n=1 Tax=Paenibacillus tundrae TaxID=528187 RepID=UPI0030CAF90A
MMTIEFPHIQEHLLDDETVHFLTSKSEYDHKRFEHMTLANQEATKVSFEKVWFKNVIISESSLEYCEFTDVIFENCDFSNVNLANAFIHRAHWKNCKLIGTDFSDSRLKNVSFSNSLMDYANFRFSNMKHLAWEECSLISTDLSYLVSEQLEFSRCKMDQALMHGTKLNGVNLSTCDFDVIGVDIENLKGCVISPYQASTFVGLLGMIIQ